jgi:hypothetical protein
MTQQEFALPLIRLHIHRVPFEWFRTASKQPPMSFEGASAPPHIARDVGAMVDDRLLFEQSTMSTTYERMMDPMLLEVLLMN